MSNFKSLTLVTLDSALKYDLLVDREFQEFSFKWCSLATGWIYNERILAGILKPTEDIAVLMRYLMYDFLYLKLAYLKQVKVNADCVLLKS